MKRPFLCAAIKNLRDKGVTVRKGFPQNGEDEIALTFEQGRYWTPPRVLAMSKLVQQSRTLILMQLNVNKGMPPLSVKSLLAKDYIRISCNERVKRRFVITERGKRWMPVGANKKASGYYQNVH